MLKTPPLNEIVPCQMMARLRETHGRTHFSHFVFFNLVASFSFIISVFSSWLSHWMLCRYRFLPWRILSRRWILWRILCCRYVGLFSGRYFSVESVVALLRYRYFALVDVLASSLVDAWPPVEFFMDALSPLALWSSL